MATTAKHRKAKPSSKISSDKAREQLGGLINRVAAGGERVVLTRHGLPVVAIVDIDDLKRLEEAEAVA